MRINTCKFSLLSLVLVLGFAVSHASAKQMRGINFVSVPFTHAPYTSIRAKASLEHLKSTGAEWISIPIVWYQDGVNYSEMHPLKEVVSTFTSVNRSPSDKEIRGILKLAQELDLKVMLVPRVEINRPGWIRSSHIGEGMVPYQVRRWFENYTEFLLQMAKYASAYKVDLLSIGHDLHHMSHFEDFWKDAIKKIKEVYKGNLTYSASSRNEFRQIGFFDELDYIGLIADEKFDINAEESVESILKKFEPFVEKIKYLKKLWKKPALITRAVRSGYFERREDQSGKVREIDHASQERYFEALHQAAGPEVEGVFFGDWSADPAHGGEKDGSISPQYKRGEMAIRKIFEADVELPKKPDEESPKMYCKYCVEIDL